MKMPEFDADAWDCLRCSERALILEAIGITSGCAYSAFTTLRPETQAKIKEHVMKAPEPYPHETGEQLDFGFDGIENTDQRGF